MLPEAKERLPEERYPYLGIVGAVGVGKSQLAELLHREFGLPLFKEEFVTNPYLEPFYTQEPKTHAFNAQIFFLAEEARQMTPLADRLKSEPVGQDQPPKGDAFFESILWGELDLICDADHETYLRSYEALVGKGRLPQPDIYIGLTSTPETAVRRIIERGRPMELTMNEKFPQYFPTIARSFNSWLKVLSRHHPVITIDTDRFDFVNDEAARGEVLTEIRNLGGYYLASPSQLDFQSADGSRLALPSFLRPRPTYVDITPGLSSEAKMLQRR